MPTLAPLSIPADKKSVQLKDLLDGDGKIQAKNFPSLRKDSKSLNAAAGDPVAAEAYGENGDVVFRNVILLDGNPFRAHMFLLPYLPQIVDLPSVFARTEIISLKLGHFGGGIAVGDVSNMRLGNDANGNPAFLGDVSLYESSEKFDEIRGVAERGRLAWLSVDASLRDSIVLVLDSDRKEVVFNALGEPEKEPAFYYFKKFAIEAVSVVEISAVEKAGLTATTTQPERGIEMSVQDTPTAKTAEATPAPATHATLSPEVLARIEATAVTAAAATAEKIIVNLDARDQKQKAEQAEKIKVEASHNEKRLDDMKAFVAAQPEGVERVRAERAHAECKRTGLLDDKEFAASQFEKLVEAFGNHSGGDPDRHPELTNIADPIQRERLLLSQRQKPSAYRAAFFDAKEKGIKAGNDPTCLTRIAKDFDRKQCKGLFAELTQEAIKAGEVPDVLMDDVAGGNGLYLCRDVMRLAVEAARPSSMDRLAAEYSRVATKGAELIETNLRTGLFTDVLSEQNIGARLGASLLTGLRGNITIPYQAGVLTGKYYGDKEAITPSDTTFSTKTIKPVRTGAAADIVMMLERQNVEALPIVAMTLGNLIDAVRRVVDKTGVVGAVASGKPTGAIYETGVPQIELGTNGGRMSLKALVDMVTNLRTNHIDQLPGVARFVFTPEVIAYMLITAIETGDATRIMSPAPRADLTLPGSVVAGIAQGYEVLSYNDLPKNNTKGTGTNLHTGLLMKAYDNLFYCEWGGVTITNDTVTKTRTGERAITINGANFSFLRRPNSLVVVDDINAA